MAGEPVGAPSGATPSRLGWHAQPPLLQVQNLRIAYGASEIVRGISFELDAGASLAIVGESGSGKTQVALAILGLNAQGARVEGSIRFEGRELVGAAAIELNEIRGARIGMVFQDSMTSLNPHLKIGVQVAEGLQRHRGLARDAALAEARRLLDAVQIADATARLFQYPHECSGGMRQRIAIAMALACKPSLLIADEPTTALDMTVQAQILQLLRELRREFGLALLLISHDFGVVEELCERVLVMYDGEAVEQGPARAVLDEPGHAYTQRLLAARLSFAP